MPYAAAMGGAAIGASPVPGAGPMGGDAAAVASGGASLMANLGKAGGWEPTCEFYYAISNWFHFEHLQEKKASAKYESS